jgi:diguanylate cyclase (GGDEF)-like protein/PAS domain S-box-containing protein
MVLDNNNAIIAVNPSFSTITGYSFDEVEGHKPRIALSEWQDKSFQKTIWRAINRLGYWQGEIWNRRKNGDLYAKRVVINTIFTDSGKVDHRVVLFSDVTEKKEAEQLIWHQANYDALTVLPNRQMFMDRLAQDIKISNRSEKPLALIFLDLDRFKEVNDTLGHKVGDELLCEAAKRLVICLRESDTVVRLGGDEFVVILAELEDIQVIERVAKKILAQLSQFFLLANEQVFISASLGIAIYPDDSYEINELIKYADQAMYISKQLGRNRFSYFTPSMQQ